MSETHHDLIIIGSGPAGLTAAVYAARAQLSPVLFEGAQPGGALTTTSEVENFPGFPDGITGPDLMARMRSQAILFGADLQAEDVDRVELSGPVKTVVVNGVTHTADAVILAMGSAARYLNVGELDLLGRGVSSCATCDGFFFRDHHIAVVGGGDSAMEEAIFLTRFAQTVTLVHRRESFRASAIMVDRAKANPKIRFRTNTEVVGIRGEQSLTSVLLRDSESGHESSLDVTGMFVAIGHDPRSDLVAGQVARDEHGYVVLQPGTTMTSLPGVFAAGDLVDHSYRQAITAAGSGCQASIDAQRWLARSA